MERLALLEKLDTVAPALSTNDMIPVLTHFWFNEKTVMAFNDQIAISTPCTTEFSGAVPGAVLLSLLKASKAKAVELIATENELQVKAASARLKLGLLPPDDFMFEMPIFGGDNILESHGQELMECIDSCMRSVSTDTSVPDQLGVTLIQNGQQLDMYSTNNATMSHASVKTNALETRAVLSGSFCKEMLSLVKSGKNPRLAIHDDYSLLVMGNGTTLFGRLVEVDKPIPFREVLNHNFPAKHREQLIPIPTKMRLILERACIITDSPTDQGATTVTIKEGRMRFVSKSGRGEVSDSMLISEHPDVSTRLEPKLLKVGYGAFDHMLITESCAIMAKGNKIYMVSATGI